MPDVGRDLLSWLLGVICWGLGVFAGVFLVKALIRGAMWIEVTFYEGQAWAWSKNVAKIKSGLSAGLSWLYRLIVVAALGLSLVLFLGWDWPKPEEGSFYHWSYLFLVFFTIILAAAWSAQRAQSCAPVVGRRSRGSSC